MSRVCDSGFQLKLSAIDDVESSRRPTETEAEIIHSQCQRRRSYLLYGAIYIRMEGFIFANKILFFRVPILNLNCIIVYDTTFKSQSDTTTSN